MSHGSERILVFGASGGIGSAICERLVRQGAHVVGVGRRARTANAVTTDWLVWPDLIDPAGPPMNRYETFTGVIWAHGANAADNIRSVSISDHRGIYDANVLSIIVSLQYLLKCGALAPDARLVILSSIWQDIGRPDKLSYMVTKAAIAGLVRSLSIDLGPEGKRVNAILPGPLDTRMTRAALTADQIATIEASTPTRGLPALSDLCSLALFLASHQNTSISGQFIKVDGGFPMQRSFDIASATGAYSVVIGPDAIATAGRISEHALYLCDRNIESYLPSTIDPIFIEATEANKSLEAMPNIIRALRARKADRGSHLIAIGGGITQDIATFAASVYMRGLPWTYLPTTLLGMVDSCIGGKSSINVEGMKTWLENFYPPKAVLVDPIFLKTLDAQDIVGGLCEAVKICYARGAADFTELVRDGAAPPLSYLESERIITKSLNVKRWFIEVDEFDQHERLLLNFGHTFGHALESATHYEIKHGVGVGIGMLVAIDVRKRLGPLDPDGWRRCEEMSSYVRNILSCVPEIGSALRISPDLLMEPFEHDKKHRADEYRLVLPTADGSLAITSAPKTKATRDTVMESYSVVLAGLAS